MERMKKRLLPFSVAVTAMLLTVACGNNTDTQQNGTDSTTLHDSAALHVQGDTTLNPPPPPPAADTMTKGAFTAVGVIGDITNGKDGYMATLTTDKGVVYSTVFSIISLEKNYKKLNAGDRVQVSGDTMHLGDKLHIKVKQFSLQ